MRGHNLLSRGCWGRGGRDWTRKRLEVGERGREHEMGRGLKRANERDCVSHTNWVTGSLLRHPCPQLWPLTPAANERRKKKTDLCEVSSWSDNVTPGCARGHVVLQVRLFSTTKITSAASYQEEVLAEWTLFSLMSRWEGLHEES